MKVSIITCTYNSAKTLSWNLESVSSQSYDNIEHVIIDNESCDDTLTILEQYSHNKVIVSEKDEGIYFGMNKGLQLATGDIIGFLNSDDYLAAPDVIEKIVKEFKLSGLDGIYGNLIYVKSDDLARIHRVWKVKDYTSKLFLKGWMLPHPTFYVRRDVYEKYGTFNTEFKLASDYELMLRFLLKYKIKVKAIDKVLVYMRTGGATNKDISSRIEVHKEDRKVWRSIDYTPFWYTLYLKPIRKIFQFIVPFISIKWITHKCPDYSVKSKG